MNQARIRQATAESNRPASALHLGLARVVKTAPEISEVWGQFRLRGSSLILVVLVVLGFLWGWSGGFVLAGIAAISVTDAFLRQKGRSYGSLFTSVAIDLTLIGAGVVMADLRVEGIAMPYIYMMAIPLLLLPLAQSIYLVVYASIWTVIALSTSPWMAPPPSVDPQTVSAVAFTLFATLLLFLIGVVALALQRSRELGATQLRQEHALRVAGENLLAVSGDPSFKDALEALRDATGADAAFVAENTGDAKTGPAAHVRQVSIHPDEPGAFKTGQWTLPYLAHAETARQLAEGETVRLDEALGLALGAPTDEVYAIAVPIFVRGEWDGFLGIAHLAPDGSEPEPNLSTLETIATMIGASLERQAVNQRLEQLIKSKDQFLASVSHEIRTPLTSVLGFASLMKQDPDQLSTEEGREIIELIEQQALEVSDLVEDLLVAARAEIDAINVHKVDTNLAAEIQSVLSARLGEQQSDIFVAASPAHRAIADPTRVRQIIRNLLTNALRYGGEQITITTHRDGSEVLVVFSDNGDGIPAELRRRLFDPYERGNDGMMKPESIGLGLAVSRQLARLMDGDLTLRSDLGGAAFQLSLPMAPKDDTADEDLIPAGAIVVGKEVRITVDSEGWGLDGEETLDPPT